MPHRCCYHFLVREDVSAGCCRSAILRHGSHVFEHLLMFGLEGAPLLTLPCLRMPLSSLLQFHQVFQTGYSESVLSHAMASFSFSASSNDGDSYCPTLLSTPVLSVTLTHEHSGMPVHHFWPLDGFPWRTKTEHLLRIDAIGMKLVAYGL